MREMLHYSLEMYIRLNPHPHSYSSKHKSFLKRVHAEIKTHYCDLWEHFDADENYKKELMNHHSWLTQLRQDCPHPPLTYLDLKVCFGTCEAYMLVANLG
jgi:hypothetical protein